MQRFWILSPTRLLLLLFVALEVGFAHEIKDFDDTILYKIDFEIPDFDRNPEFRNQLRTFYTHEQEKYECVIPVVEDVTEEQATNEAELSPYALLQPLFTSPSCSYRIEAYWSYEICHGQHVRQYHEEREGKNVKFQEYKLGKWSEKAREETIKQWEEDRKSGLKYKTTKIDNTKYPYFEVEMTDGTLCDIINAVRTTIVRYVCYPHGKNEIYSFKETSSCNYEAIILTSALCMIPAFHPEESKEVSIACFNSPIETHKPLSMLRQELSEMVDDELAEANAAVAELAHTARVNRFLFLEKYGMIEMIDSDTEAAADLLAKASPSTEMSPITEFISGKNCLTGGTGWWKYEFCYGRHVRQFHKDKKSQVQLYLGFFSEDAHRQWLGQNPEKSAKRSGQTGYSASLWHHYEKGTRCDRTGLPREVDVKLTCVPVSNSATAVSMYLLEPKTCQYILVVESPIICDLQQVADEHGVVQEERLQLWLQQRPVGTRITHSHSKNTAGEEELTSSASETPADQDGVVGPTGARAGTVSEVDSSEDLNA